MMESELLIIKGKVGTLEGEKQTLQSRLDQARKELQDAMEARLAVEKALADKEAEHIRFVTESNKRLEHDRAAMASNVGSFTHNIFGKSSH